MDASLSNKGGTRVEFRLSKEDKELFEYAKELKGFKSFSEFARFVLMKEAKAIVQEEQQILASKKDKEIFFNALMGEHFEPNQVLLNAVHKYKN